MSGFLEETMEYLSKNDCQFWSLHISLGVSSGDQYFRVEINYADKEGVECDHQSRSLHLGTACDQVAAAIQLWVERGNNEVQGV